MKEKKAWHLKIAQPAQRALANAGIPHLNEFSMYTGKEIMALHGMGPKAFNAIQEAMKEQGITFRE